MKEERSNIGSYLSYAEKILYEIRDSSERLSKFSISEETKDENGKKQQDMAIRAFENIVQECRENVSSSNFEDIKEFLSAFYKLSIDPYDSETILKKIDSFEGSYLQRTDIPSHNLITNINNLYLQADAITRRLDFYSKSSQHQSFFQVLLQKKKNDKLSDLLERYKGLTEELNKKAESYSKSVSQMIIDNFFNIDIFFIYLIKIARYNKDLSLLVSIANLIDKFIDTMNPSLKNRGLGSDDLLYHTVISELRKIRKKIAQ